MRQPNEVDGWERAEREGRRVVLQEEQAFRCEIGWEEEEWVMITFDLGSSVGTGTVIVWSFTLQKFSGVLRETRNLSAFGSSE